jgi:hypothetical protein
MVDMEYFRSKMTSDQFAAFSDFVGKDNFRVDEEDFEVFYPDVDYWVVERTNGLEP